MNDLTKHLINKVSFDHSHLQFTIIQKDNFARFYVFREGVISNVNTLFITDTLLSGNNRSVSVN
ncbi:hypothetical protein D3C71_2008740 [compost metagenome]